MAIKTFKANLSVSGLNALKKQLLQYRDDLPIKCKQLVSRLLQSGGEVAETNISESPLGKYVTVMHRLAYCLLLNLVQVSILTQRKIH